MDFFNLQTICLASPYTNFSSRIIKIVSLMSSLRNIVLTSIWCNSRLKYSTKAIIVLKVFRWNQRKNLFIINTFFMCKVLSNKICFCNSLCYPWNPSWSKYPFATNDFCTFKQLDEIPYVISFMDLISLLMTSIHFWELEIFVIWWKLIGSSSTILMSTLFSWRNTI